MIKILIQYISFVKPNKDKKTQTHREITIPGLFEDFKEQIGAKHKECAIIKRDSEVWP